MDISVIIVNYNTCAITRDCLVSIFKYTRDVDFEVIVVDNDSQRDDSKSVLSIYPGIVYIQSEKNLGFGKANNLGYQHAKGRYVLLLNSDTYLQNNALKCFVEEFDKLSSDVACIGSQLLSADGTNNNSFGELPSFSSAARSCFGLYLGALGIKFKHVLQIKESATEPFWVPYVTGADICIRRGAIEKNGLFDPDFFMYYEETELQHRYQKAGYKSMIIPGPKIVHLECASTKGTTKKKYTYENRKMFLQGQFLYFRKNYSYPVYLLYRIMFLLRFPIFVVPSYYTWKEKIRLVGRLFSSTRLSI